MGDFRQLLAYQKAFSLAMRIFMITKKFPPEERYELTCQIRRASRSVCANLAEAYKRSRYRDYFVSKLNDSESEIAEVQIWLDFALACQYIDAVLYDELKSLNDEVAKLVWYMISHPEKFR